MTGPQITRSALRPNPAAWVYAMVRHHAFSLRLAYVICNPLWYRRRFHFLTVLVSISHVGREKKIAVLRFVETQFMLPYRSVAV